MTRMEIQALTKVANAAEAGRYTLPAELTDALRTYERVKAVEPPTPVPVNIEDTAGRIVATLAAGESLDLEALVAATAQTADLAAAAEQVKVAVSAAVELAAQRAAFVAEDLTERIITDHLAPAYAELLDEVRQVAATLGSHTLDPHALLTAPARIRNAYLQLPDLAARHQSLREARRLVNVVGHRKPEHDALDLFGEFAKPMALRPGWKHPQRIAQFEAPTEPTAYLLWLVSDKAAPGEPWLPTVAQQDAAYWEQFGEAQEMRKQAHHNGLAVGSRVGA